MWYWSLQSTGQAVRKGRWIESGRDQDVGTTNHELEPHENGLKLAWVLLHLALMAWMSCRSWDLHHRGKKTQAPGLGFSEAGGGSRGRRRSSRPSCCFALKTWISRSAKTCMTYKRCYFLSTFQTSQECLLWCPQPEISKKGKSGKRSPGQLNQHIPKLFRGILYFLVHTSGLFESFYNVTV